MKRIAIFILVISFCFSLIGCVKTENQSNGRRPAAATHSHSSKETTEETTEDLDAKFAPIIEEIDEYIEDLDFVKAVNVALYNMNHYPEYSAFTDKHNEALLAYQTYVDTQLQKFIDTGNYPGAIDKLNSFIADDGEREFLIDRQDTLIKEYKDYAYNTALTLAYDEKYTEALNLVYESLKYFESKKVEDLIPILETYIPVAVGDMEIFLDDVRMYKYNKKGINIDTRKEDNYGNTYKNSFYCEVDWDEGEGYVTYLTNHKYSKIYGTVACSKGATKDSSSARLSIIGEKENGEVVELWDEWFYEDSRPKQFSVDITEYERITLCWHSNYSSYGNIYPGEDKATIFDGYFVPVPEELPEIEATMD